ncbi:unnamed protein product [Musa textilis]
MSGPNRSGRTCSGPNRAGPKQDPVRTGGPVRTWAGSEPGPGPNLTLPKWVREDRVQSNPVPGPNYNPLLGFQKFCWIFPGFQKFSAMLGFQKFLGVSFSTDLHRLNLLYYPHLLCHYNPSRTVKCASPLLLVSVTTGQETITTLLPISSPFSFVLLLSRAWVLQAKGEWGRVWWRRARERGRLRRRAACQIAVAERRDTTTADSVSLPILYNGRNSGKTDARPRFRRRRRCQGRRGPPPRPRMGYRGR